VRVEALGALKIGGFLLILLGFVLFAMTDWSYWSFYPLWGVGVVLVGYAEWKRHHQNR
jgi:uncharacterized membrane protein